MKEPTADARVLLEKLKTFLAGIEATVSDTHLARKCSSLHGETKDGDKFRILIEVKS